MSFVSHEYDGAFVGLGEHGGRWRVTMAVAGCVGRSQLKRAGRSPAPAMLTQLGALGEWPVRVIACSGGVDSPLLVDHAHEEAPNRTLVTTR